MSRILFIAAALRSGGAERSLINLLDCMDKERHEIGLLLFERAGELLAEVPDGVRIPETPPELRRLYSGGGLMRRAATAWETLRHPGYDAARAHRWVDFYSRRIPPLEGEWDVAVAWLGGDTLYYAAEKVNARRRAVILHTDPSRIRLATELERRFLDKTQLIAGVSERCADSLRELFPEYAERIRTLENLTSPERLRRLAQSPVAERLRTEGCEGVIVSVGRLVPVKGFDLAVGAMRLLTAEGRRLRWYVVGEGSERRALERLISRAGLKDSFVLLGGRENPYPYMKAADVFAQTSRYEGKSMVVDEAKLLGRTVVLTDYPTAGDQLTSGEGGLICPMTERGIADAIAAVLDDPERYAPPSDCDADERFLRRSREYINTLLGEFA